MLYQMSNLAGMDVIASDGNVGYIRDIYFDDASWRVRYFVVDAGRPERRVLLSPEAIARIDPEQRHAVFNLTSQQVQESPDYHAHEPISRRMEMDVRNYFGWPVYWPQGAEETRAAISLIGEVEPTLRSGDAVIGYYVHAQDGDIGHIDDFLIDDATWEVRYLIIDTRNWVPGKKVVIAPEWVMEIDWVQTKVHIDLDRTQIQNSPEFDPNVPMSREYEEKLYGHYHRDPYWR